MSEYVSSPLKVVNEGEQLDIKVPKSSVQVGVGGVVCFKEDGTYQVEVSDNQRVIIVSKIG